MKFRELAPSLPTLKDERNIVNEAKAALPFANRWRNPKIAAESPNMILSGGPLEVIGIDLLREVSLIGTILNHKSFRLWHFDANHC